MKSASWHDGWQVGDLEDSSRSVCNMQRMTATTTWHLHQCQASELLIKSPCSDTGPLGEGGNTMASDPTAWDPCIKERKRKKSNGLSLTSCAFSCSRYHWKEAVSERPFSSWAIVIYFLALVCDSWRGGEAKLYKQPLGFELLPVSFPKKHRPCAVMH